MSENTSSHDFTIWPAIDLRGGRCVRLRQGRADEETVYSEDPVAMARHWRAEGARALHVVDLDGAFQGRPIHLDVVARIVEAVGDIPVELGGGLRTEADVEAALHTGVRRVILGTRACADPETLQRWAARFGMALAVGIDVRDGRVAIRGWQETVGWGPADFAQRMAAQGIRTFIVTDISRDGVMEGAGFDLVAEICDAVPECDVIASGGVTSPEDILRLRGLRRPNLRGAIVGRALYERRVRLPELQAAADAVI